jgi:hypothetical protein
MVLRTGNSILAAVLIYFLSLAQCSDIVSPESIEIPDMDFLNLLIENGFDKNGDGKIDLREAEETASLEIRSSGISNLSGLEYFTNLDSLLISFNPLEDFDISANASLRHLEIIACDLSALDLSKNGNLEVIICENNHIEKLLLPGGNNLKILQCGYNHLKNIDVSMNPGLITFTCNNNWIDSLDIGSNIALEKLITCGNMLTFLDISSNQNLRIAGIDNMPMLKKVCVWTLPFPPEGLNMLMDFSPNVEFVVNC